MSLPVGDSAPKPHKITVLGGRVLRDGVPVRVIANTKTGDLRVGCTHVTRDALMRLVELSHNTFLTEERVVQEGEA